MAAGLSLGSHLRRRSGRRLAEDGFVDAYRIAAPDDGVAGHGPAPQNGQQDVADDPGRGASPAQRPAGDESEQRFERVPKGRSEEDARPEAQSELGGGESRSADGQEAGRQDFGQELQRERRTAQSRPAQLPGPDVLETALSKRLLEWPADEMSVQPLGANELCRGGVFRDLGAQRFDAAAGLENLAPPKHGLALSEAETRSFASVLPARLVGIEKGALDLCAEILRPRADRRRADNAGVRPPAGKQALDIVDGHQNVGIGDNNPVAPSRLPSLDDIVELWIGADSIVPDQELRRAAGIGRDRS